MPTIDSFEGFDSMVRGMSGTVIFRGVTKASYDLKPSVGRIDAFRGKTHRYMEKRLLQLFKENARPHLIQHPRFSLEWLALAQHHGLPTRLLDWTYNPLVALFFAVEADSTTDSLVYAYSGGATIQAEHLEAYDPFTAKTVIRYRPSHITPRIAAQQGLFTTHPSPQQAMNGDHVTKIRIKSAARAGLKKVLSKYGVSWRFLFPDLDGLTKDLKWLESESH